MKHYIYKSLAVLLLVLATSCASTKYLSIDVLQPARVAFPENIVNIAIVDNAGATLDSVPNTRDANLETINSIGKNAFVKSLCQFMQEEDYFYDVKLYPQIIRADKNYDVQVPLFKSNIQSIASEMDADAIISVDTYTTESGKTLLTMDGFVFSASQTSSTMLFRIYDASGELMTPTMSSRDSIIYLEDRGFQYEKQYYEQLALQLSEGAVKQLIPYWETQERRYYTDGTKLLKQANTLVETNGNWTEAAKVWGAAFEQVNDTKKKAKIAANIALANENLGDLENAANWIRIASNLINVTDRNSVDYQYINWYKIKLLEREQNNPKVLEQLGEEPTVEEG